jgi:hypothetical protein
LKVSRTKKGVADGKKEGTKKAQEKVSLTLILTLVFLHIPATYYKNSIRRFRRNARDDITRELIKNAVSYRRFPSYSALYSDTSICGRPLDLFDTFSPINANNASPLG